MPSKDVQEKLIYRTEKQRAQNLMQQLSVSGDVTLDPRIEMPPSVTAALRGFMRSDVFPDDRISDSATDEQIDQWCISLISSAGISGQLFVGTGMGGAGHGEGDGAG